MLTCVASSKQLGPPPDDDVVVAGIGTPRSRHGIKALTTQIKEMALKASGVYRQCKPCSGAVVVERRRDYMESEASVSGNRTPPSMSGLTEEAASVFMEEEVEGEREWIAQVEPGVLITFVSVSGGGNGLKRIRFSREMFNKWQAQRWWAENHEKVMELYNVQGTNHPPPTLPGSEDESSKKEMMMNPMTPPLNEERPPGNSSQRTVMGSSSSTESHEQHQGHSLDSPVLSSNSGAKTGVLCKSSSSSSNMEEEEVEGSGVETSVSTSNEDSSDQEREWVQQDEPGVYLTIRARPGGVRELRRVRFSRERFGEMLARMWWEENRDRIHQQYLFKVN